MECDYMREWLVRNVPVLTYLTVSDHSCPTYLVMQDYAVLWLAIPYWGPSCLYIVAMYNKMIGVIKCYTM